LASKCTYKKWKGRPIISFEVHPPLIMFELMMNERFDDELSIADFIEDDGSD
jgi:hypothetical protein